LVLLAALGSLALAFCIYYHVATRPMVVMLSKPAGEMDWLRMEFNLTDEQFAKIKALQEAYQPKCGQMCQRIMEADAHLDQLINTNTTMTPRVEAALKQCAIVQADCRRAMLGHIYAVAAEMSPVNRDRYLQMMEKSITEPRLGPDTAVSRPPDDR
jgi:Spy/CpxP family protein refolding chaperone